MRYAASIGDDNNANNNNNNNNNSNNNNNKIHSVRKHREASQIAAQWNKRVCSCANVLVMRACVACMRAAL